MNAGDLFRHYRVIEKVGEGGMVVVYRARDTKLDRDVALKFMVHATGVTSEHADRLRREARALAALNHPNILTIHDIGETDGLPFLVLEWVGDGALSNTRFQRPLSTDEFLRIVLPVADALGTAHQQAAGRDRSISSGVGRMTICAIGLGFAKCVTPSLAERCSEPSPASGFRGSSEMT